MSICNYKVISFFTATPNWTIHFSYRNACSQLLLGLNTSVSKETERFNSVILFEVFCIQTSSVNKLFRLIWKTAPDPLWCSTQVDWIATKIAKAPQADNERVSWQISFHFLYKCFFKKKNPEQMAFSLIHTDPTPSYNFPSFPISPQQNQEYQECPVYHNDSL